MAMPTCLQPGLPCVCTTPYVYHRCVCRRALHPACMQDAMSKAASAPDELPPFPPSTYFKNTTPELADTRRVSELLPQISSCVAFTHSFVQSINQSFNRYLRAGSELSPSPLPSMTSACLW